VKEVFRFDNSSLFLTIGGCIEDKSYIQFATAGVCDARVVLLYMCHSLSGYILETRFVREWGCIVVRKFRAALQLPQVIEEFASSLNGGGV